MGLHLSPFDPANNFKAMRGFRADGVIWEKGSLIDKDRIGNRELKRLYENHRIEPLTDDEESALAERLGKASEFAANHRLAKRADELVGVVIADPALTVTIPPAEDRIAKLIADNDKDALTKMAEGLEVAPPGNKPELAAAIVAQQDADALAGETAAA